jgi:hypothetical protein
MLQKVYLNTQKTMVYKICVVVSCKYEVMSILVLGNYKKKDQVLLTTMMVVLVFIFVVFKKIKELVLIYIIAFLNFGKSQTTTDKTNSFFMKTINSLRFLK